MTRVLANHWHQSAEPASPSGTFARSSRNVGAGCSGVAVDGDPLDVLARLFGLRQADGQHAIAEVGFGLVLLDAIERNAALERAVVALAVFAAIVVFGLFLAADRQD